MANREHEVLTELFQNQPALAVTLLHEALFLELPEHSQVALECSDLTDQRITEYKADAVVSLRDAANRRRLAVVVEVQRARDDNKWWSWPYYLAAIRAQYRCPAALLVVCTEDVVAKWAAQPIELGHPHWWLSPLALGPGQIPRLWDATEVTRDPELGILSALAHSGKGDTAVLEAVCSGFDDIDATRAREYTGLMLALLPAAARVYVEELVATGTFAYMSEFTQQYVEQGLSEGRLAQARLAVVQVLEGRGFTVSDQLRARIESCAELDQLTAWIRRATTVERAEELFDSELRG